jgi:hypothetical protein
MSFLKSYPECHQIGKSNSVIDLLPGTAPISKRPYRMSLEELKELKK